MGRIDGAGRWAQGKEDALGDEALAGRGERAGRLRYGGGAGPQGVSAQFQGGIDRELPGQDGLAGDLGFNRLFAREPGRGSLAPRGEHYKHEEVWRRGQTPTAALTVDRAVSSH